MPVNKISLTRVCAHVLFVYDYQTSDNAAVCQEEFGQWTELNNEWIVNKFIYQDSTDHLINVRELNVL